MKPTVFIASSSNKTSLKITNIIASRLKTVADVRPWPSSFFAGEVLIQKLIEISRSHDFGIFVFHTDDIAFIKRQKRFQVRDNVLFELGLFMGTMGHKRCFVVSPKNEPFFRKASDLEGIVLAPYHLQKGVNGRCVEEA